MKKLSQEILTLKDIWYTLGINHINVVFVKKTFIRDTDLERHMITDTGKKIISMYFFWKQFHQKRWATRYIITHTGETSYQCNFCDNKFSRKDELTRHMITHTEQTSYQCTLCKNKFSRKYKLLKHITHTGDKPYQCSICDKVFVTSNELQIRMKIHYGQKKRNKRSVFTSATKKTLPNKGLKRGPLKQKKIDSKSSRKMWEIVGQLGAFAVTERWLLLPVNIIMVASKNIRQN